MQKTNTKKMGVSVVLAIAILSFGALASMVAIVVNDIPLSLANDGGTSGGGGDNGGDSGSSSGGSNSDSSKSASESAKQQAERAREASKQQFERTREANKQQNELLRKGSEGGNKVEDNNTDQQEVDGDGDFDGDESADSDTDGDFSGDNNGMFKDRTKTMSKLQEEIAKTREDLLKKQAEGTDVTAALARLALAESGIAQVGSSFDANDLEKAKMLAKDIKKETHFTEKDLEFAKQASEELSKITERFGQVSKKIAQLEALGGDASTFKSQLASLQTDFSALQASMTATPNVITRETVRAFESKVKRLKSMVEGSIFALGGTEDGDLIGDHKEGADDLSENLSDVADIESGDDNGVSSKVKRIAAEHQASVPVVETDLKDIKDRSGVTKLLFGPNFSALDNLSSQIAAMNARATALDSAAAQITDPDIKQILLDQAKSLRSEVGKLQSYVTAENSQFSIFGKLLSFFR